MTTKATSSASARSTMAEKARRLTSRTSSAGRSALACSPAKGLSRWMSAACRNFMLRAPPLPGRQYMAKIRLISAGTVGHRQCQRQQDARLLRIQVVGDRKPAWPASCRGTSARCRRACTAPP